MKKYPNEVQKHIDYLDTYKEYHALEVFNLIHMYPKELAYPNGYYDSRFFDLVLFNEEIKEKRTVEGRDGIYFNNETKIKLARIFADGSTLIKFDGYVKIKIFQCVEIYDL